MINGDTIVLMITGEEGRILRALKTLEFDETSELFIGAVSTDGQFSG